MTMATSPGILYVTMQPKPDLDPAQFQDWYNNEHGPLRVRLTRCIKNGFRYRATDVDGAGKGKHEWMAIYDLTDTAELNKDEYLTLRGPPIQSDRERGIRPHVDIDRRSYDLLKTWEAEDFQRLEQVTTQPQANIMVSVLLSLKPGHKAEEVDRWYNEEHVAMIQKVPGWRRTRRFITSPADGRAETEYLALHEYGPEVDFDGPEFRAVTSTPWTQDILANVVEPMRRRVYTLNYTFGPAPRDLAPLTQNVPAFHNEATGTKTSPGSGAGNGKPPALEASITTSDGARLPYRIEGSSDPDSPVIVLSNSILVDWSIWDEVVSSFLGKNPQYRVLRYLTRGRSEHFGSTPVTVDLLAADVIALLDALRIPKVAAAVGVSLGGATVLAAGLLYPKRIERFLSCDTGAKSPAGNAKTWSERIDMAAGEDLRGADGRRIVGAQLAEKTARRWFVGESYDGGELETKCMKIEGLVKVNDFEGFVSSVKALWEYDYTPLMKDFQGKGAFLVGREDGVLPEGMQVMAESLGARGTQLTVVDGAGHLPMVEKAEEVVAAVEKLLSW